MTTVKKEMLLQLVRQNLHIGHFFFTAGQASTYYFDGRGLTLSSEGPLLVGELISELICDLSIDAIGGPTLGAAPIVTAVQMVRHLQGKPVAGFLVREDTKVHGMQKMVEGHLPANGSVVVVEDTVSTGKSVFRAIKAAEEVNCKVVKVIAILDWQQGGSRRLQEEGYDFHFFLQGDLTTGELSLWTPSQGRQV